MTDVARASGFYSSVLGWESDPSSAGTPSSLAGTKSVHFFSKGVMHGAFHLRDSAGVDAARPGAVTTFLVDSIEDSLAKVEAAGGKTVVYVLDPHSPCSVCYLLGVLLVLSPEGIGETVKTRALTAITNLQPQDRDWRQHGLLWPLHRLRGQRPGSLPEGLDAEASLRGSHRLGPSLG